MGTVTTSGLSKVWWDFGTPGSSLVWLSGSPLLPPNNYKLWDIKWSRTNTTRRVVFQLVERFANPIKSKLDICYLITVYKSGEVLILDFNHVHL